MIRQVLLSKFMVFRFWGARKSWKRPQISMKGSFNKKSRKSLKSQKNHEKWKFPILFYIGPRMFLGSLVIIFHDKNIPKPVFSWFPGAVSSTQNHHLKAKNWNWSNMKPEIQFVLVGWTPYAQDLCYSRVPSIPKVSRRSDKYYYQNSWFFEFGELENLEKGSKYLLKVL